MIFYLAETSTLFDKLVYLSSASCSDAMPILSFHMHVVFFIKSLCDDSFLLSPAFMLVEELLTTTYFSTIESDLLMAFYYSAYIRLSVQVFYLLSAELAGIYSQTAIPSSGLVCPDTLLLNSAVNLEMLENNGMSLRMIYSNLAIISYLITPIYYICQILLSYYILLLIISMQLTFFSQQERLGAADIEGNAVLLSSTAEKELFAIEDSSLVLLLFIIFFSSYFGFILSTAGLAYFEASIFLISAPILILFILIIPINLLFDFGAAFTMYLRGAALTGSLIYEAVYDTIAIIAFFTRLVVQFIRVIVILSSYIMMHKAVIHFYFPQSCFFFVDNFNWAEFHKMNFGYTKIYFMIFFIVNYTGYLLFEILHTLFLLIVQFFAFCVIVFWLFLLFYTFFKAELTEHYFWDKRK